MTRGTGAGYRISGSPLSSFFRELLQHYKQEMVGCMGRLEELKNLLDQNRNTAIQPSIEVLQEVMHNQYKYLWSVAAEAKRKLDLVEQEEKRFLELCGSKNMREQAQ